MTDDPDWAKPLRRAINAARLPGAMGNSQWDSGDDWTKRSREACPDDLMKQIVEDNRRGGDIHGRASVIPPPKASQQSEATPQDRIDAAARARQLGLSPEEWARLSEADLKARKEQQAKKAEGKK